MENEHGKSIFLLPYNSRLTFNVTQNELDDKDKEKVSNKMCIMLKLPSVTTNGNGVSKRFWISIMVFKNDIA